MAKFKVTEMRPREAWIDIPDEDLEDMSAEEIVEHVVFQTQEMNSFDQADEYGKEEYIVEKELKSGNLKFIGKLD